MSVTLLVEARKFIHFRDTCAPTKLNPPTQRQLTQIRPFLPNWAMTTAHHCNWIPLPRSSPRSRSAMHSGMVRKILVSRQRHSPTSKVRLVPTQWQQAQMRPFLSTGIATIVHRSNWTTDPRSGPQSRHSTRSGVPRKIILSRQRHNLVVQVRLVPILQPLKNTPRPTMHNCPNAVET